MVFEDCFAFLLGADAGYNGVTALEEDIKNVGGDEATVERGLADDVPEGWGG